MYTAFLAIYCVYLNDRQPSCVLIFPLALLMSDVMTCSPADRCTDILEEPAFIQNNGLHSITSHMTAIMIFTAT
jgi:hypothetical protein